MKILTKLEKYVYKDYMLKRKKKVWLWWDARALEIKMKPN